MIQALAAQLAAFQALLLVASAAHKLLNGSYSRNVVRRFAGTPASLTAAALAGAISGEAAAAVLLMLPSYRTAGAVLASFIWAAYLALILRAIAQGRRDLDCGCGFGPSERPLGPFHAMRNAALLGLSVTVASAAITSPSVPLRGSHVLPAFALLALYGALDQVMALRPLRRGEA